jgi:thiol-disulfide isomerase/thioredoxin
VLSIAVLAACASQSGGGSGAETDSAALASDLQDRGTGSAQPAQDSKVAAAGSDGAAAQEGAAAAAQPAALPPGGALPERLPKASEIPPHPGLIKNGLFAPDFSFPRLDAAGGTFTLSDYVNPKANGKADAIIVAFMASWCGICHASLPTLKEIYEEHGGRLQIVIAATDELLKDARKEAERVAAAGLEVPVVQVDEVTRKAWLGNDTGVPRYFFVNKIGEVIVRDQGFGKKVRPIMPGQARFVMKHPEYVPR